MNLRAFPDFSVTVDNIITQGNMVACNYKTMGTHQEEYLGIDPTGNKMTVDGCFVGTMKNGKLVEGWNQFDALAIMMGLEVLPTDMLDKVQQGMGGRAGTRQ